jgi:hypothetical protein
VRVSELEARLYRIPPPIRIQDSIQRVAHWEWVVTSLTTESGRRGTGFAYTNGFGGTAIRELVDTYLAPLVRGQDARDVRARVRPGPADPAASGRAAAPPRAAAGPGVAGPGCYDAGTSETGSVGSTMATASPSPKSPSTTGLATETRSVVGATSTS